METPSLRSVVEGEGQGKMPHARMILGILVQLIYRPARKMLAGASEEEKQAGREGMRRFATVMNEVAVDFAVGDDLATSLLARHNAASGMGWLDKHAQNTTNARAWEDVLKLDEGNPDAAFVRSKIFFGRFENDPTFAATVSETEWTAQVDYLFNERFPDAPGRALRLARHFAGGGKMDEALKLLRRATSEEVIEFGKADQVADVREYCAQHGIDLAT